MKSAFLFPVLLALLVHVALFFWGGWQAFFIGLLLSVLEVTLSFDNAVVNAKVLARMDEKWRRRFLTLGILIAVFGTRLVLPVLIVSLSAFVSPLIVAKLALFDSAAYGHLLEGSHAAIGAFGGMFLSMVALKYFFDEAKDVHWISVIEHRLAKWGRIEAIEITFALAALLMVSVFAPVITAATILAAGIIGIMLFIVMQGITQAYSAEAGKMIGGGVALFVYLNILDSAFSLDGVVGAFAITSQLPIIVVGLGTGAYFVRAITLYLVERKTLETLVYLEHGAHWAIFGLAASMLLGLIVHVPEAFTGLIGLVFVCASYISSIRYRTVSQ